MVRFEATRARRIPGTDQSVGGIGPVAANRAGAAIATWSQSSLSSTGDHGYWSRHYVPGRGWSGPLQMYAASRSFESQQSVVVNDDGSALAMWIARPERAEARTLWWTRLSDGRWADSAQLTPSAQIRQLVGIRSDSSGGAIAMWLEEALTPSGIGTGPVTIWVSRFAAD